MNMQALFLLPLIFVLIVVGASEEVSSSSNERERGVLELEAEYKLFQMGGVENGESNSVGDQYELFQMGKDELDTGDEFNNRLYEEDLREEYFESEGEMSPDNVSFMDEKSSQVKEPEFNPTAFMELAVPEDKSLLEEQGGKIITPGGKLGEVIHPPNRYECSKKLTQYHFNLRIVVYLDFCPSRPECEHIKTWTKEVKTYTKTRFGSSCGFEFVLIKGCVIDILKNTKLLDDETLLHQVSDGQLVTSGTDNIHKTFVAKSDEKLFTVNIFNEKSGGINRIRVVTAQEKQWGLRFPVNLMVCKTQACVDNKQYIPLRGLMSISKWCEVRIVHKFFCPNLAGGIPVQFYDLSGNMKCVCKCQAGFQQQGQRCVRIHHGCACAWSSKCYTYNIGRELHNRPCVIKNWFRRRSFIPLPMSSDNYVSMKPNKWDKPGGKKGEFQSVVRIVL